MINSSWDIKCNRQIFCHLESFFFYPLSSQKIEKLKINEKTPGDIIIAHRCTKNHDHMLYCSWYMACDSCNFYFSFWAIFSLLSPNNQKNQIFKKMKRVSEDIIILHIYTKKLWLDQVQFLGYGARQTEGLTDGRADSKKWYIEVGAPPKTISTINVQFSTQ